MLIGIIANITKESVLDVVSSFTSKLGKEKIDYILTNSIFEEKGKLRLKFEKIPSRMMRRFMIRVILLFLSVVMEQCLQRHTKLIFMINLFSV